MELRPHVETSIGDRGRERPGAVACRSRTITALSLLVSSAAPALSAMSEHEASQRPQPGTLSPMEILRHLVGTADGLYRIVAGERRDPAELLVSGGPRRGTRVDRHATASWHELIVLWVAYNYYLVSVFEEMDPAALRQAWRSCPDAVTLEFLATEYLEHVRQQLSRVGVAS